MTLPASEALATASTGLTIGVAVMALIQLTLGHRGSPSTAWLVVCTLAIAAMGLGDLASQLAIEALYRVLQPFADSALLVIGPSLWLYVRQSSAESTTAQRRVRTAALHLAPAGLLFVLLAAAAAAYPPDRAETHRSAGEIFVLLPIAAHLVAYAVALVFRVTAIRRRTQAYYSNLDDRDLRWIAVMTLLYAAGIASWMLTWQWSVAASNALTGIFVAAATGWLGVRGSRQRVVIAPIGATESAAGQAPTPEPAPTLEPAPASEPMAGPYSKARLPDALAAGISLRLATVMNHDKAYLESDLTLADLASRVEATAHQLSQYLSVHEQQSFYDYVNRWRVEAVKATLLRPGAVRRPLMEVALECGFGSKSAFNAVFKRFTGLSPSAWRDGLPGTAARPPPDASSPTG